MRSPLGLGASEGGGASMGEISSEGKLLGVSGSLVEVGLGGGGGGGGVGVVILRIPSAYGERCWISARANRRGMAME